MSTSKEIVQRAYEAFSQGDVDTLLGYVADQVDWEFVAPASLPYAGRRSNKQEVAAFFSDIARADDISAFEPREFIEAGEHLTVLGWEQARALDTGVQFDSSWVHVFTVKEGKITRWRGFSNTAARYGK
ncbi:MAG: nuclear transport factor 2 family protein [Pseudomonadota bacterium]